MRSYLLFLIISIHKNGIQFVLGDKYNCHFVFIWCGSRGRYLRLLNERAVVAVFVGVVRRLNCIIRIAQARTALASSSSSRVRLRTLRWWNPRESRHVLKTRGPHWYRSVSEDMMGYLLSFFVVGVISNTTTTLISQKVQPQSTSSNNNPLKKGDRNPPSFLLYLVCRKAMKKRGKIFVGLESCLDAFGGIEQNFRTCAKKSNMSQRITWISGKPIWSPWWSVRKDWWSMKTEERDTKLKERLPF